MRINDRIRAREVLLIGPEGKPLGLRTLKDAIEIAVNHSLDLVEVAPLATPPVCKIMDFGRYKYELAKKDKETKKKQRVVTVKEVKLRCKIDDHDFDTKARHAKEFLSDGHKVKATVMFRGREVVYADTGRKLLARLAENLTEVALVERGSLLEGKNMVMILSPKKAPAAAA